MKKVIGIITLLAVLLSLASCGGVSKRALVGTWEASADLMVVEAKVQFTFNDDGTGSVTAPGFGGIGMSMNYTLDGEKLSVSTPAILGISKTVNYTVALEKDTLTLTDGGTVLTLQKVK